MNLLPNAKQLPQNDIEKLKPLPPIQTEMLSLCFYIKLEKNFGAIVTFKVQSNEL